MTETRNAILFGAFLFGMGWLIGECTGCSFPQERNIEYAAIVVKYELLLEQCKQTGKIAQSYEVYEACAKAADRRICADYGVMCRDVDGGK